MTYRACYDYVDETCVRTKPRYRLYVGGTYVEGVSSGQPAKTENSDMKKTTKELEFCKKVLEPLRVRALQMQERYEHATKKYRHDRTTEDGVMTVDRKVFMRMVGTLQRIGLLEVGPWSLPTLYVEVGRQPGQSNIARLLLPNETTADALLEIDYDEHPTVRVPASCVVALTEEYISYAPKVHMYRTRKRTPGVRLGFTQTHTFQPKVYFTGSE